MYILCLYTCRMYQYLCMLIYAIYMMIFYACRSPGSCLRDAVLDSTMPLALAGRSDFMSKSPDTVQEVGSTILLALADPGLSLVGPRGHHKGNRQRQGNIIPL